MTWGSSGWGRDMKRPAGQYRLPADVQALPLDLKRSQIYPRSPGVVGRAISDYQDACRQAGVPCVAAAADMPTYLPQRMQFQQYKLGPAPRNPLASVYSVMAAAQGGATRTTLARVAAQPPQMALRDAAAARYMDRLPTDYDLPSQRFVSRGLPRHDKVTIPSEYANTPVAAQVAAQQAAVDRAHAREQQIAQEWAVAASRPEGVPIPLQSLGAIRGDWQGEGLRALGFAPSTADRNSSITLFQREQNRLRAALNALVANAPEARAANPLLYENSIMQFNNLLGNAGAYFEQIVYTAAEDTAMQAALESYTTQVETLVGQVQRMLPTAPTASNPPPPVDTGLPTPTRGAESTAPTTPIAPPPGSSIPQVLNPPGAPKRRTWLYYGLGAVGVLSVTGMLGIFFLNRKKRARR